MPPKKNRSKFYFYMQDWKKWKEAEGQRFSLDEVRQLCACDWDNLPEKDKRRYKEMENEAKQKNKNDLFNKYNSLGTPLEASEKEERERREAISTMENSIASLIASVSQSRDSLMKEVFYLVHANVYCYWSEGKIYIPCEIAISKFSVKEGVMATYHVFPAPCTQNGKIPLGYMFDVKKNAEDVHGLSDPSELKEVKNDYKMMRSDIHQFLKPNGGEEIPPLYTMDMDETNHNCHISAVKTFFETVAGDSYDQFKVYSLTRLFFELYGACRQVALKEFQDLDKAFPVEGSARHQLLRDVYQYCAGLACEFHEDTDKYHNCSESFVKRWVFVICEFCCPALRIEMIPGRHCVATAKISSWATEKPKPAFQSHAAGDDDDDNGAWSTVPKVQHGGMNNGDKAKTTADCLQEEIKNLTVAREDEELIVKPIQQHKESKFKPLQVLAVQQQQQQSTTGVVFSAEDFPAIGAAGQATKPSGSGWGRSFMSQ